MFSISNDLLNSVDMQENINVLTVIDNNHRQKSNADFSTNRLTRPRRYYPLTEYQSQTTSLVLSPHQRNIVGECETGRGLIMQSAKAFLQASIMWVTILHCLHSEQCHNGVFPMSDHCFSILLMFSINRSTVSLAGHILKKIP